MGKVLYRFSEAYLEYYLSEVSDELERAKIKMAFRFSGALGLFFLLFLPVFNNISSLFLLFGILSIAILWSNLYILNRYKIYKSNTAVVLSYLLLFNMTFLNIALPDNPMSYMLGSVIAIALATFILNKQRAIGFAVITFLGFTSACWLKSEGMVSGWLVPGWSFNSTVSNLTLWSPLKLLPLLGTILYVLIEFTEVSKKTQNDLDKSLTTQLRLNNELKRKETKYRRLVESAGDMVYEINGKGMFTYVNPTFEKITGFDSSSIINRDYLSIIPDYFREKLDSFYQKQIERKITVFNHHFPIITKSGEEIWVGQTASLFYTDSGQLKTSFCVGRDVTSYRATQQKLMEAKVKAEEASLLKAQFLSSMSHEIRTPINAIIGNIHLLKDENTDESAKERLDTLKFSADNLMALISDILDFNKLDASKMELKKELFNLSDSMTYIKLGFDKLVFEKGIGFAIEIDKKLPQLLLGDSFRLTQILNNLVHNAIKFTASGGVVLTATEHLRTPEIIQIHFSVTDTGIGIQKEDRKTIFEEFAQANNEKIREGAGLGLSISQKLAALFGSEIKMESVPGEGSKFWFVVEFKIPVEGQEQIIQKDTLLCERNGWNIQSLAGRRILLVEDNIINQKVTGSFLKKWNADFDIAANGKKAVQLVEKNDYDMVLMDLQMPLMNGVEATRKIRAMKGKYTELPIVALTASAVLEIKEYAMAAGLTDFLTKPFTPKCLNYMMHRHLKKVAPKATLASKNSMDGK